MKHIFAIILVICSLYAAQAQIVPNGGFEEWDSTYTSAPYPFPPSWVWFHSGVTLCPLPGTQTLEPSPLSSSGCCSVKTTTTWCRLGFIYTNAECTVRPAHLNFQYMFHPEGGDSSYVKIVLFNYDSVTSTLDTVGFASGYMHEEVESFTPFSLPIQYFTEDTPTTMHIFFSTSKTVSQLTNTGFGPPGPNASAGTALWLDDVQLSGATDISEQAAQEPFIIFPNPAGDRIWFKGPEITGVIYVLIFNAKGAQVMDQRITALAEGIVVGHLGSGVYSIALITGDSEPIYGTWVKE